MIQFTEEERNIIAEFFFSYETDVLLISDAINLVKVFSKHNLISNNEELLDKINNKSNGIAFELKQILLIKVSKEQCNEIMDEYYGINNKV